MTVEIAVQDVEGARIAHEEGADRVELCAALMGTGGLTPSFGMIQACSHVGVPQGVQVLIRPRGGSFAFTDEEKYVQIADVRSAILAGASGVVVGGMTEDGRIDVPFTRALAETGVSAIHLSAKRTMTSDGGPGGGGNGVMVCRTDRDVVRAAVAAAR